MAELSRRYVMLYEIITGQVTTNFFICFFLESFNGVFSRVYSTGPPMRNTYLVCRVSLRLLCAGQGQVNFLHPISYPPKVLKHVFVRCICLFSFLMHDIRKGHLLLRIFHGGHPLLRIFHGSECRERYRKITAQQPPATDWGTR